MTPRIDSRAIVRSALRAERYAVLATEAAGQPQADLMAFAAVAEGRRLVFATRRDTRKLRNLADNDRVAVFIDHARHEFLRAPRRLGITAVGVAHEVNAARRGEALQAYLRRNPDLEAFADSPECTLVEVDVESYRIASGVDRVEHCRVEDCVA